jgi:hypothetical protein
MRFRRIFVLALGLATTLMLVVPAVSAQAPAPTYTLKARIPIPTWEGLTNLSVDISWIDPETQTYIFADRSPQGGAIEVIDAANYTFVKAAALGQFVGVGPTGAGGPNGVVTVGPKEAAGGDGDSTLKVVNLITDEVQSISTGGTLRVDEMAYDPSTDLLLAANDRAQDSFVTVFKIHPLSIVGKIPYPQATAGIEQPLVAGNGNFYISIPATEANPGGEINLINPSTLRVERVLPLAGECTRPTGLAWGVGGTLITGGGGCLVDPSTGSVSKIPEAGGDQVASDPSRSVYAYTIGETQSLNLADGTMNDVYQKLYVAGGRNQAINPTNGEVFIPDLIGKAVLVYSPMAP